jgi:hypothetical protein
MENVQSGGPEAPVTLLIQGRRQTLRIERSTGNTSVYFSQTSSSEQGWGYDDASLRVYDASGKLRHNFSANDFASLRHDHPAEINQYLGPVFRDLKATGVVGPEPKLARQVLAASELPNDVAPMVRELLKQLESDSFVERDAAARQLRDLNWKAIPLLIKLQRDTLSPHQQTEIDAILREAAVRPAEEIERLRNDIAFMVDCLYCEDAASRGAALRQLEKLTGESITLDTNADPLSQAGAIEGLRHRLKPETAPAGK